jgi:hypothetical protein
VYDFGEVRPFLTVEEDSHGIWLQKFVLGLRIHPIRAGRWRTSGHEVEESRLKRAN